MQPECEQRADASTSQQFTDLVLDSRLRGNDGISATVWMAQYLDSRLHANSGILQNKKGLTGIKYGDYTLSIQERLACSLPGCGGAVLPS